MIRFIFMLIFWYFLFKFIRFLFFLIVSLWKINAVASKPNVEPEREDVVGQMDDISEVVDADFEEL